MTAPPVTAAALAHRVRAVEIALENIAAELPVIARANNMQCCLLETLLAEVKTIKIGVGVLTAAAVAENASAAAALALLEP